MPVSEETFKRISLEDPDGHWELDGGCLRQKPDMTYEHNQAIDLITRSLHLQLSPEEFVIRADTALIRRSATRYYIPDVMVIPRAMARRLFPKPGMWEVYTEPLPLVVEVWSPSTGRYDVTDKLAHYQRRGDQEIWRLHPYELTLTVWRRQPDGSYQESLLRGGRIEPAFVPNVSIDLDELFRMLR
jgi:Uma2 family endonuclease